MFSALTDSARNLRHWKLCQRSGIFQSMRFGHAWRIQVPVSVSEYNGVSAQFADIAFDSTYLYMRVTYPNSAPMIHRTALSKRAKLFVDKYHENNANLVDTRDWHRHETGKHLTIEQATSIIAQVADDFNLIVDQNTHRDVTGKYMQVKHYVVDKA